MLNHGVLWSKTWLFRRGHLSMHLCHTPPGGLIQSYILGVSYDRGIVARYLTLHLFVIQCTVGVGKRL